MGTLPLTVTLRSDFSCIASPLRRTGRLGVVGVGRGTAFAHNPGTSSWCIPFPCGAGSCCREVLGICPKAYSSLPLWDPLRDLSPNFTMTVREVPGSEVQEAWCSLSPQHPGGSHSYISPHSASSSLTKAPVRVPMHLQLWGLLLPLKESKIVTCSVMSSWLQPHRP